MQFIQRGLVFQHAVKSTGFSISACDFQERILVSKDRLFQRGLVFQHLIFFSTPLQITGWPRRNGWIK